MTFREVNGILEIERYDLILKKLNEYSVMTYEDLKNELPGVSIATIRRDINKLYTLGKLMKVSGGITSPRNVLNLTDSIEGKFVINKEKKMIIAEKAAAIVENNSFIYLDSGTTVFYMIPFLKNKNCKVVTNGLMHIKELIYYEVQAILLGGNIKSVTEATIGVETFSQLSKFKFDMAFMGTNAISTEHGYMTPDSEEACIKEKAIKNSQESYVLSDSTKFDTMSKVVFSEIDNCLIITEDKNLVHEKYLPYLIEEV